MTTDDERRTPIDQALDLFVYLPVGFLFELPRCVPRFIERGRHELHASGRSTEVGARLAPVHHLDRLQAHAQGTLRALGMLPPDASDPGRGNGSAVATPPSAAAPRVTAPEPDAADRAPALAVDDLAIPGYDSLSASQVMPRLEGLTAAELEQVRRYEQGNRGRRTILNKIVQLQSR